MYERIPWESLERPQSDRQWLIIAIAGAVAIGALAYSFMKGQPSAPQAAPTLPMETGEPLATIPPAPSTVPSPVVVTEADLFAVDPERLIERAAAHAEWFAVEYFSVDGSEESQRTLQALLPTGVPLPQAPSGVQVFVDWARAQTVSEVAPLEFEVEVLVRSLLSGPDGVFQRHPPRTALLQIAFGPEGEPRVISPPVVMRTALPTAHSMGLVSPPSEIISQFSAVGEVVGAVQLPDGRWKVVVMTPGPDGVVRPTTALSS